MPTEFTLMCPYCTEWEEARKVIITYTKMVIVCDNCGNTVNVRLNEEVKEE